MSNDNEDTNVANLRDLGRLAVERARSTSDISDIEKAASISKSIADAEKVMNDNLSQQMVIRFEWYKTMATAIVPFLTILTLGFTVWIQIKQFNETALVNADTGWRDTAQKVLTQLRPIDGAKTNQQVRVDGQLTIQLLRPYFSDPRHGTEAIDLAMLVVSRTDDERAASIVFGSSDIKVTELNFATFLYRAKEIRGSLDGLDDPSGPAASFSRKQKQKIRATLWNNLRLICAKIGEGLHSAPRTSFPARMDGVHLLECDLSGVEFGNSVVKGTAFERADLRGADLSKIKEFSDSEWRGSNWWEAKAINGPLLLHLLKTYFPYVNGDRLYSQAPPAPAIYRNAVKSLCRTAGIDCQDSILIYGPQLDESARLAAVELPLKTVNYISIQNLSGLTIYYESTRYGELKDSIEGLIVGKLCTQIPEADVRVYEVQRRRSENISLGCAAQSSTTQFEIIC